MRLKGPNGDNFSGNYLRSWKPPTSASSPAYFSLPYRRFSLLACSFRPVTERNQASSLLLAKVKSDLADELLPGLTGWSGLISHT